MEAFIPEPYVESDSERLEIYRRLYRIKELKEVEGMRVELRDRFGAYPPEAENLFMVVELRLLASKLAVVKLMFDDSGVLLSLSPDDRFFAGHNGGPGAFQKLMDRLSALPEYIFRLKQEKKTLTLAFEGKGFRQANRLASVKTLLTHLLEDK